MGLEEHCDRCKEILLAGVNMTAGIIDTIGEVKYRISAGVKLFGSGRVCVKCARADLNLILDKLEHKASEPTTPAPVLPENGKIIVP